MFDYSDVLGKKKIRPENADLDFATGVFETAEKTSVGASSFRSCSASSSSSDSEKEPGHFEFKVGKQIDDYRVVI